MSTGTTDSARQDTRAGGDPRGNPSWTPACQAWWLAILVVLLLACARNDVCAQAELPREERNGPDLVYFYTPGCRQCEEVGQMLAALQEAFPDLAIERHNIRKPASARLNEALSKEFAIPESQRLVTPAVFAAAGSLIKD